MKRILLLICTAFSIPAFVPPPKPSKSKALPTFGQVISQKEAQQQRMHLATLAGLPDELKQEILRINAESNGKLNIDELAKGILRLAGTSRALRVEINNVQNILTIINSLPKGAAIYFVEKLGQMPVIQENMLAVLQAVPRFGAVYLAHVLAKTPGMQNKEVQDWLKSIKLEDGSELYDAVNVQNPDLQRIEKLLQNPNIDVNWKDQYGDTALRNASSRGHLEIVRLLLAAGANVNVKDKILRTALIRASDHGFTEIVQILLDAGADVNTRDHAACTALIWASISGRTEIVRLLIAAGADVNVQDDSGMTALMHASARGYSEIVKLLLDAGADSSIRDNKLFYKKSALDFAYQRTREFPGYRTNEYKEIIKILEAAEKAPKEKAARK